MGAFDAKYSQLKTYCVITKEPGNGIWKDRGSYNSLPRNKQQNKINEFRKENKITFIIGGNGGTMLTTNKNYENNNQGRVLSKNNSADENFSFISKGFLDNNILTSGLKNRSIVTLKQENQEPQFHHETLPRTQHKQNNKERNSTPRPKVKTQIKSSSNTSTIPISYKNYNSDSMDSSIKMQYMPYKNYSIHSSLRKNKYLDFYNGFTNKPGLSGGLYFSLPPMKDRESPPIPKPTPIHTFISHHANKQQVVSSIERDIPIKFDKTYHNPSHSKILDPAENYYYILEQLKIKSGELAESEQNEGQEHQQGTSTPIQHSDSDKSFTFLKENSTSVSSGDVINKNKTRGTIPLFTTPNEPLLYNNNSKKFILPDKYTNSNTRTGNGNASSSSSSSSTREVIIVIEREFNSHNPCAPNFCPTNLLKCSANTSSSVNETPNITYNKPHNFTTSTTGDCNLIESIITAEQTQYDPIIITTPYDPSSNLVYIGEKTKYNNMSKLNQSSISRRVEILKKNSSNTMDVDLEIEEMSCVSDPSLTSSTSSLEAIQSVEDLESYSSSLLFHDCFENDEFKSCEDEDDDQVKSTPGARQQLMLKLKKCSGVEWLGGDGSVNDEQVNVNTNSSRSSSRQGIVREEKIMQFSPGSDSEASTKSTVKGGASAAEMITTTTNIAQTHTCSSLLLSQQHDDDVSENNMVTTQSAMFDLPIQIIQSVSGSGNIHNNSNHNHRYQKEQQDMNSVRSTSSNTTKKFKSRILVNADCGDYDSIDHIVVTNVEITGGVGNGQVGIVTGRGTFIHHSCTGSELNHQVQVKETEWGQNENEHEEKNSRFRGGVESICHTNSIENEDGEENNKLLLGDDYHDENGSQSDDIKYEDDNAIVKNIKRTEIIPLKLEAINLDLFIVTSENNKLNMNSSKNLKSPFSCRRESPEGEESDTEKAMFNGDELNDGMIQLNAPIRSSPDGADNSKNSSPTPNAIIEEPIENYVGDEDESTDSWTEEAAFDDDDKPPPLDLTLHTIVEESCEESEVEFEIPKTSKLNELEKYYNFTTEEQTNHYEESEFSDTFSESSLSFEIRNSVELNNVDQYNLETGRLEKYFLNLGLSNDSDSVGSESDSECSVLDNRKKVLKHHRRSAEFEDSQDLVSEDDECAFEQDGLDTIKKQRKLRRSNEDLLDQVVQIPNLNLNNIEFKESSEPVQKSQSQTETSSPTINVKESILPSASTSVSRSNSFTWSSDEEVNLMMSKLRHLIKNMVHIKKVDEQKNDKLIYLENELVRLMKNENIKNIVESISSDSDEDVYKLFEKVESNQPELLSKVMTHIGKRLSTWMKDTDEFTDDGATIKCAPSISSDLNEDRFSWKGSFESTLAKRQSVGSSDSIDGGGAASVQEGIELFSERSILRSSSLHHLATSQPILEECEPLASSLSRLNDHPITNRRSKHGLINHQEVKSGRYRPPGYFENMETHVSTPTLNTFSTNKLQDGFHPSRKHFSIRGQIEFLMQYNYKCSTFEICIKQCRDLAAVDPKRGRSDPYVKVYLLPERAKSSKKKTKVKKNTLNPMFSEILKFPVALEELENRILWLTVWHSGLFGKNEFLGEVLLNLRNITFDDVNYKWFQLQEQRPLDNFSAEESQTKQNPVLSLALKWSPRTFNRGNLTILIKEAKGLKYIKNSCPSTFVKCSPISEKSKKQKTPLCRKTLNPVWNTTMTFENITNDGIELGFYNYDLLNHELISNVKLDPDCDVWREMGKREGFWVEGIASFD